MKRTIFVIFSCILICLSSVMAHENVHKIKNGKTGITLSSFGTNDVVRFKVLDGDASYNGDDFSTLGITYIYTSNKLLEAETGIENSKHNIIIKPNVPPDADDSSRESDFSQINIPLTLHVNFLKYFFFNGGLIVDIDGSSDCSIENQTGIDMLLGVSIKYDFDPRVSAFINSYSKVHSLIPFTAENIIKGFRKMVFGLD